MPITLSTGPINAGKTASVLELLAKSDPGRTGMVIVPDRGTAAQLRRRYAAYAACSALRADAIQDWASFVRWLARPLLPVASRQHTTLIALRLLGTLRLMHFGKAPRSYTMAQAFAHTMLALKSNLVKPADLEEIVASLGEARPRERDLITVYHAYEKELSRLKLLDEGDLTLLAIGHALEGKGALAAITFIAFDEFTMPAPAELAMLRALGKGLPQADIHITCPAAFGEDVTTYAPWLNRAHDTWSSICDDEKLLAPREIKRPKVEVLKAASPAQEARHVALLLAHEAQPAGDVVVATKPRDTFLEWYLSEAHSMQLLPEHPTLDGAQASPLAHTLLSAAVLNSLPREASLSAFTEELRQCADFKAQTKRWIQGLKQRPGHGRVAARSLTATAIIEETLLGLASATRLLGDDRLMREQFAQLISDEMHARTASDTTLESVLPFRLLYLGTPLACSCERLIVPRMTEGSFPSRTAETLFFGDWQEESIRRIFKSAEDTHACESFAFETMLAKCRGFVTLIMPEATDAGSETIPSPFADRFLTGGLEPRALSPCTLDRTAHGRGRASLEQALAVESARMRSASAGDGSFANFKGILEHADARAIVRKRFTQAELSATALERYANCPFSFFALHVLRTREAPEDTPEIHGFDRGRIVHDVLARYYQIVPHSKQPSEKHVREMVNKVWDEHEAELDYVSPGLKERELQEIALMVSAVIDMEAGEKNHLRSPLTPTAFEWSFGRESDNALEIPVGEDVPLFVRGRVDRVDSDADGSRFLVIDYKTGRKKEKQIPGQIASGSHLQLPLYIEAVSKHLMPKACALGGLLIDIRDIEPAGNDKKTPGKTRGMVLEDFDGDCYRLGRSKAKMSQEYLEELISTAQQKAGAFAQSIRAGIFPASDQSQCDYCDYGDICRKRETGCKT